MTEDQQRWNRIYQEGETFGVPRMIAKLAESLPPQSRVLDYGCGKGQNAIYLAKKGLHVIGFDISDKSVADAVEDARMAGVSERTKFFVSDGLNLGINLEASFDGVVCSYVLDYFPPGFPEPIDAETFRRGLNCVQGAVRSGGLVAFSYSPKHIWPQKENQKAMELDRQYSADNFRETFVGWEELLWDVGQNGEKQTKRWGTKNNLDVQILARKPEEGEK